MKRVLIICRGPDSAGTGMALKAAFDQCGKGWEARMVRRKNTWLDYPADVEWPPGDAAATRLVRRLWARADIVHIMQVPTIAKAFRGWERKPTIVAQIGTYFRDKPEEVSAAVQAIGATEVVNSLELLDIAPHAELLMWTVDLEMLAALRRELWRPSERIRIVHAPTNREIKSTAAFLAATERLARRYPIDVDLIEGVPWRECLARKAQADILYDEVKLGYGLNAAEAWAMGMPALVGLEAPGARQMFVDRFGGFPWLDTTEATIGANLEALIVSPELRAHWGDVGFRFVNEVHSAKVVVPQAIELYERVIAGKKAAMRAAA